MTSGWPIDVIGIAGATLTTLCWLPQAFKVIREKETRALSLPATGAFTVGVGCKKAEEKKPAEAPATAPAPEEEKAKAGEEKPAEAPAPEKPAEK